MHTTNFLPEFNPLLRHRFPFSVVSKLSAAEPLIAIQIEATIGLVKVGAVFNLAAVGQLLRVQARTALDEQGHSHAVHRVAPTLKEK